MKQILQSYRSGELWLAECPAPACSANGVLVRTRASVVSAGTERMLLALARKSLVGKAIARPDLVRQIIKKIRVEGLGSTLEKVFAKLDEPVPLGYSAMGTVLEVGRATTQFQPGDRVAIAGAGYACHAEANAVPRTLCARVPDAVSDEDAAFATVGAIALQGVRQTDPKLGERIVVIGLGLLGLLTVQMLKANGCAVYGLDPDPRRVALAIDLGADAAATTPDGIDDWSHGVGADAVIITAATSANGPIETAGAVVRQKGRVVVVGLVGMDVPRDVFYRKELDLRLSMSYGPGRYDPAYEEGGQDYPLAYVRFTEQRNLESFLYLVAQGTVTPARVITHRFAFADALEAYQLLEGTLPAEHPQAKPYLGIVLTYPSDAPLERTLPIVLTAPATVTATPGVLAVACLGVGGFAKGVLLPRLAKYAGVRLVAVGASRGTSAEAAARRFRVPLASTDPEAVIAAGQAVVIATPHASHARYATAALRTGRHVFVEKPLCLRPEDIDAYAEALAAAAAAGHHPCLMVGFNRRFSPHVVALRAAVAGRSTPAMVLYRVNAGRIPAGHWIQDPDIGGGRILGEVCHFVDACGTLIGSAPRSVHARSIASGRSDLIDRDAVVITITYADGSLATIQYLSEGHADLGKERIEVHAGGISAVCDDFVRTRVHGARGGLSGKQAKGFDEELTAFVTACREGSPWPIPWADLVATQQVCWAALRSLETAQSIIVGED